MDPEIKVVTVDETNLDRVGFFCYKSKRKSNGYTKKLAWVRERLAEGLRLHILFENGVSKGFIESIPGQFAWRAVNAECYLFIHCMWVVGKAKGKGYGSRLLDKCIQEASESGFNGVSVLASEETWLADCDFFQNSGFEITDTTGPAFSLMALSFNRDNEPSLPTDWASRIEALGPDLTVVYSDQCPYIDRMKGAVHNVAGYLGIPAQEVYLSSSSEVQSKSPSPYGVYNIVYRDELIASHPIGTDALMKLMQNKV
jgi:N-acetylglutamate synthase-like GNAT family acetyltransferase